MTITAPADLTELPNWVLWKYMDRDGKRTKVPYSMRGGTASSTNPGDWATFDDISAFYSSHKKQYAGIGVVFDGGGMCGVDLDHCLNDDQSVKDWAQPIIGRFSQTYMEVSPSGTGIKIWCLGKLPGGGGVTEPYGGGDGRIEIYARGRYFTVTGEAFNDAPLQVENEQPNINWLLSLIGRDKPPVELSIPSTSFDMPAFIERYVKPLGWQVRGPFVNHHHEIGGMKWRIEDGCPFQRDYSCGSPALMVTAKGAAYFKCWCGDHGAKGWQDIKLLVGFEPPPKYLNGHHADPITSQMVVDDSDEAPEKPLVFTPWPEPLSAAAYHGPIGEMCRLIEPNTEADIAAVLFQALVMVGNVMGRGVHWAAEATPHFANEFVGIVGATAKGRKGSSFGQVRRVIGGLDQNWAKFRIKSGLTSGEGLIFHVRDAVREIKTTRGKTEEVVTDPGETDKRMLVVEEELATAIKAMSREGNTLSGVLRQAWDSPLVLAPMTKNNRITASHPHVSIIGHITRDELLKSLKAVENTNGGTNRFLWCCARRSKLLPFGGQSGGDEMAAVSARLDQAIGWAQTVTQEIGMDGEAAEMWAIVYEELGDVPAGTVGAILSRAEAHVRRVAMIYAVMDRSLYVRPAHLEAALEVWRYSANSVRWIFGDVPSAEQLKQGRVLKAIPDAGANRREITQAMGGKIAGSDLEFHLGELMTTGKIRLESEKRGKRACEYYYPVH